MDEYELSKKKSEIFDNINNNEKPEKENKVSSAEETLSTIATWILIIGIIVSILLITTGLSKINEGRDEEETGYSLLIITAWLLPSSIISWGVLTVICNISNTLHEINKKLK